MGKLREAMSQKPVVEQFKRFQLMSLVHWLFYPGELLSQRVVHAGFWAFALRITNRLFGLARTIVLARLLSPNDFGLFGIALLALSALESFSQTGFDAALIQRRGDIKSFLNTAWTVQVFRGFALALVLVISAPLVASFFKEPRATVLLQVLAVAEVLKGFTNIGVVFFRKELEFHKEFIYLFSGTLANLVVAISAALILRNAWALVYGSLASSFAMLVSSYILSSERPRFQLMCSQAKELFSYGGWLLGVSVLAFLSTQGDRIIVGKLMGTAALGLYQVAWQLVRLPTMEISKGIIGTVAFPTLSAVNIDKGRLTKVFFAMLETNVLIILPLVAILVFLADPIVLTLLEQQWMPAVPAIKFLAFPALLFGFQEMDIRLYMAIGSPKIVFWFSIVRVLVSLSLAVLLIPILGLVGAAVAVLLSSIVLFIAGVLVSSHKLEIRLLKYLQCFFPAIAATAVAIGVAAISFTRLKHLAAIVQLLSIGTAFLVAYGICVYVELRLGWVHGLPILIRSIRGRYDERTT